MERITVEQAIREFQKNGWGDTVFTCPDGAKATVAPCCYGENSLEGCEYFLIYWDMPWGGESTIEGLVNTLNRHEALAKEQEELENQIHQFFDEHEASGWNDESWSFYSDWHKDIFGYRPHARVCGEYAKPY